MCSYFTAKAREAIGAGQPVYISGHSGNTPEVLLADYAVPAKMPAFGIASAAIANNGNGAIATAGDLKNIDTTGTSSGETWAVGDNLYVNGSKLTNVRPSSETQAVQSLAKVIRVHANVGQLFLSGAGRVNDIPNLSNKHVFIGDTVAPERRQLTYTDILNTPPTTTINNNADNRVITGSDTADTLEGEADFTWDGSKGLISGSALGVNDPVLHLKTDNTGWNRPTIMAEDSNGKVFSQVGQLNTGASFYQYNITLDPDNTQPRTNVGGTGQTFAGDYFVGINKNYSNTDAISMDMEVFGANGGFNLRVKDDWNGGGGNQYGPKPFNIIAESTNITSDGTSALTVASDGVTFYNSYTIPTFDGLAGQVLITDGDGTVDWGDQSGGGIGRWFTC